MYVYHGKSLLRTLLVLTLENLSGDLISYVYNAVPSVSYSARHIIDAL